MKKSYVRIILIVMICMAVSNVHSQGIKGLFNKNKKEVTGEKEDKKSEHTIAKPLAPDVKNAVSEIRSLTGLTKAEFDKKVKSFGYTEGTDETGISGGGTIYKSKTKGTISVKMGTRGKDLLTIEVTKYTISKNTDLSSLKTAFLNTGKQCTDLKAEFKEAKVDEKGKMFSGVSAKNTEARTSKFLPALDKMISAKKEFFVLDEYAEPDYTYRINYFYIKASESTVLQLTVVDNTVNSQEG